MRRLLLLLAALVLATPGSLLLGAGIVRAAPVVSIVEDNAQLLRPGPAARERALNDWQTLGADLVRISVIWRDADAPAAMANLDAAIAGADARGLGVLLTPTGPAPKAVSRCRPRRDVCDPDPGAYGAWVGSLAARYPTVHSWALWNEPNNWHWLQPQRSGSGKPRSPVLYRDLARAGTAAVRAADNHGDDRVLVGEAAPMAADMTQPPARQMVRADDFLRAFFRAGGVPEADGLSHHPYPGRLRTPLGPDAKDQYSLAGLPGLRAIAREAKIRGGLRGSSVWITELAFQTNPPDRTFGMPLDRQVRFIAEAERFAETRGAASIAQYVLVDERALSSFQSGLRWVSGVKKPSYNGYRAPLVLRRSGKRATIWGRVRPIRTAGTSVRIETGRGTTLLATTTSPGGIVTGTIPAPQGAVRLAWRDASGAPQHGAWTR